MKKFVIFFALLAALANQSALTATESNSDQFAQAKAYVAGLKASYPRLLSQLESAVYIEEHAGMPIHSFGKILLTSYLKEAASKKGISDLEMVKLLQQEKVSIDKQILSLNAQKIDPRADRGLIMDDLTTLSKSINYLTKLTAADSQ